MPTNCRIAGMLFYSDAGTIVYYLGVFNNSVVRSAKQCLKYKILNIKILLESTLKHIAVWTMFIMSSIHHILYSKMFPFKFYSSKGRNQAVF